MIKSKGFMNLSNYPFVSFGGSYLNLLREMQVRSGEKKALQQGNKQQ